MKPNGLLSLPTKAFTLVSRPIHKHFRGDDITEREEHLHQLSVPKLLGQMVDEQVTALGPCSEGRGWAGRRERQGGRRERQRKGERARQCSREGGRGRARRQRLFQDPGATPPNGRAYQAPSVSANLYVALGKSLDLPVPQWSFRKGSIALGLEGQAESMSKQGRICQGLISCVPGNEVLRKEFGVWGTNN